MANITIELKDSDYQRLLKAANYLGKSVPELIQEWIAQLPKPEKDYDVTNDPVFQMEGYDSEAQGDLSINSDQYIYGEGYPK